MTLPDIIVAISTVDRADLPALLAAIAARMAEARPVPVSEADELLDVDQCRKLLGKSKSWLYHNHKTLPFSVKGIGAAPRFSRKGLEQYIAKHSV